MPAHDAHRDEEGRDHGNMPDRPEGHLLMQEEDEEDHDPEEETATVDPDLFGSGDTDIQEEGSHKENMG